MTLRDNFSLSSVVYTVHVIPFGFKASPFHKTIEMVVTYYLRSQSINTIHYIYVTLAIANVSNAVHPFVEGYNVAYIFVEVLTRLGYTLALGEIIVYFIDMCQNFKVFWLIPQNGQSLVFCQSAGS